MEFHLAHFDGPLDLLLQLIAKNKVNIYDIPIAQILEQYLAVLHQSSIMDLEVAGDFVSMAAQLMLIKSRMLLPRPQEDEQDDPRAALIEQLLEYQRIQQLTPYFREREAWASDMICKPMELLPDAPREYRYTAQALVRAAQRMLERERKKAPPSAQSFRDIVGRETAPVSEKITLILQQFRHCLRLRFDGLFRFARNRSEIVATFLAVLELSKLHRICLEGEGTDVELTLAHEQEGELG